MNKKIEDLLGQIGFENSVLEDSNGHGLLAEFILKDGDYKYTFEKSNFFGDVMLLLYKKFKGLESKRLFITSSETVCEIELKDIFKSILRRNKIKKILKKKKR